MIVLRYDNPSREADLVLDGHIFLDDDGLETAVSISLFTDARVDGDRGWWADKFADISGDVIGSKLWTLGRAKVTTETLRKAEDYAREALQWMIRDGVVKSISVRAEAYGGKALLLYLTAEKPLDSSKWDSVWEVRLGI